MGIARLDDMVAWQLANSFKIEVYRLLREHPKASADWRFRDQIRAAAVSAAMNIGEGFYRYSTREFARFLSIALASLGAPNGPIAPSSPIVTGSSAAVPRRL